MEFICRIYVRRHAPFVWHGLIVVHQWPFWWFLSLFLHHEFPHNVWPKLVEEEMRNKQWKNIHIHYRHTNKQNSNRRRHRVIVMVGKTQIQADKILFIMKTCLFKYTENFTTKQNESFQIRNSDVFHISAQNIDCGFYYIKVGLKDVKLISACVRDGCRHFKGFNDQNGDDTGILDLAHFSLGHPEWWLTNSAYPDQRPQNAASDQCLHCINCGNFNKT